MVVASVFYVIVYTGYERSVTRVHICSNDAAAMSLVILVRNLLHKTFKIFRHKLMRF